MVENGDATRITFVTLSLLPSLLLHRTVIASDFATDSTTSESDITSATNGPDESEHSDIEDSQNQPAAAAQSDSTTA